MSNWKVSRERIEIFPHFNADTLEIGKVGSYQVVVQKGLYQTGDIVIFAPEKSILTGSLRKEYENYLVGPDKNRVKSVVLRGEYSCGIIIPESLINIDLLLELREVEIGVDISEKLNIRKHIPVLPEEMSGKGQILVDCDVHLINHDCEMFSVYADQLFENDLERLIVTEKLHGTQVNIHYNFTTNYLSVSSKGFFHDGLELTEYEGSIYWRGVRNVELEKIIKSSFSEGVVQIIGEIIPAQGGYTYGQEKPVLRIFKVRHNDVHIPYDKVSLDLQWLWVPIIVDGYFSNTKEGLETLRGFAKGKEMVSGRELHIREGVVVEPYNERKAKDGIRLSLKILNPKYKETGEELN